MVHLLTTLTTWLQDLKAWLQSSTGLTIKDLALFAGGSLMVVALLWLGLYGGKQRYREAARFGWFLLFAATGFIAFGLYHHNNG